MKLRVLILTLTLVFQSSLLAQSNPHRNRSDQEIIQDFLRGSEEMLKLFDRRFEQLVEKFYQEDMEQFFQEDNFDQFFKNWAPFEQMSDGQSHWMETPTERILILKIESPKDSPVEIEVEDGNIIISGKVETNSSYGTSVSSFKKVFSVPHDVHADQAKFENNEGEILIKFPKKRPGQVTRPKKAKKQRKPPSYRPDIRPLKPGPGDISI